MRQAVYGLVEDHGAALVAVVSGLLSIAASSVRPRWPRWLLVAVAPLAVAVAVYWMPVWSGAVSDPWRVWDLKAWAWVVVPPWYALGVAVAAAVTVTTRRLTRSRKPMGRGSR